jgi:hypothetical protein
MRSSAASAARRWIVAAGFLACALLLGGVVLSAARATVYPDVTSRHWAYPVISAMTERGLIRGYPDGFLYPDRPVSRAEVAVMLVNVLGLKVQPVAGSAFADLAGHWAAPFAEAVKEYLPGDPLPEGGLVFRADEPARREEVIVALVKATGGGADPAEEVLTFADADRISPDRRAYLARAAAAGWVRGYPDGTVRPGDPLTRAEMAALLFRVFFEEHSLAELTAAGKLYPIDASDPAYAGAAAKLARECGRLDVGGDSFAWEIHLRDVDELLYVFARLDPARYFTFEKAMGQEPEALETYLDRLAQAVWELFPMRRLALMMGYTHHLDWDPRGVFDPQYVTYEQASGRWRIDRFYAGRLMDPGRVLDRYPSPP